MAGKDIARTRVLARLSHEIARIEERVPSANAAGPGTGGACGRFEIEAVDAVLGPAGLEPGALHEVRAGVTLDGAAASGFALGLGAMLAGRHGRFFWVSSASLRRECAAFFAAGIAEFGLDPRYLARVQAANTQEALWAAGEIAATPGAGLCLLELQGNPAGADFTFTRRIALRAAASRTPVILLRQGGVEEASAASSRWCIRPALSHSMPPGNGEGSARQWQGNPTFEVALEKSRTGRTGRWIMEWKTDERIFALAGPDRQATATPAAPQHADTGPALSRAQPALAGDRPDRPAAMGQPVAARRAS
ncbi:MAG: hypothetical protein KDJ48_11570 [Nitratireductor sp.]|nr:hypothetical protein [Nitratireductor sp.]MCB1455694.1 hypothetical protein [Nitratireductor sp.]MCB1459879.1 hypothetical protein [Nitratireductor sp.]